MIKTPWTAARRNPPPPGEGWGMRIAEWGVAILMAACVAGCRPCSSSPPPVVNADPEKVAAQFLEAVRRNDLGALRATFDFESHVYARAPMIVRHSMLGAMGLSSRLDNPDEEVESLLGRRRERAERATLERIATQLRDADCQMRGTRYITESYEPAPTTKAEGIEGWLDDVRVFVAFKLDCKRSARWYERGYWDRQYIPDGEVDALFLVARESIGARVVDVGTESSLRTYEPLLATILSRGQEAREKAEREAQAREEYEQLAKLPEPVVELLSSPESNVGRPPKRRKGRCGAGGAGDYDGDGKQDLVTERGAPAPAPLRLFLGKQPRWTSQSAIQLRPGGTGRFRKKPVCAGDLNADGYADAAIGNMETSSGFQPVLVYLGGPEGLTSARSELLAPEEAGGPRKYQSVGAAGDVNGDGFDDLLVSEPDAAAIHVYAGSASGPLRTPLATIRGSRFVGFGLVFGPALGDLDGDGFDDFAVVTRRTGNVYLFGGGARGPRPVPMQRLTFGKEDLSFDVSVAATDVDGDGRRDLVIGASGPSKLAVFRGTASGFVPTPSKVDCPTGSKSSAFGARIAALGDVNGDGRGDLAVIATKARGLRGQAHVFLGGQTGLEPAPYLSIDGPRGERSAFGLTLDVLRGEDGAPPFMAVGDLRALWLVDPTGRTPPARIGEPL